MITGDNLLTAQSIAREIGILTDGLAIEGNDFRRMTPEQQRDILKTMQVMARCSPQDKLTMVRRLKEMGEVVSPPAIYPSSSCKHGHCTQLLSSIPLVAMQLHQRTNLIKSTRQSPSPNKNLHR